MFEITWSGSCNLSLSALVFMAIVFLICDGCALVKMSTNLQQQHNSRLRYSRIYFRNLYRDGCPCDSLKSVSYIMSNANLAILIQLFSYRMISQRRKRKRCAERISGPLSS